MTEIVVKSRESLSDLRYQRRR